MIKLYYHPFSTFGRRARMSLIEKDVPAELVVVELPKGAHKSPEYLALNPYGRVPTLVEDDFVLYESTAILEYIEATHPTPPLVPADARGRALVSMQMKLCDIEMGAATSTVIRPKRFQPQEKWDLAAMAQACDTIQRHLGMLEKQLEGHMWIVGDAYSLADICYTPFVQFLHIMDVTVPPAVAAWTARLLERPSALATKPAR
jgi:glutathione S-transferase